MKKIKEWIILRKLHKEAQWILSSKNEYLINLWGTKLIKNNYKILRKYKYI